MSITTLDSESWIGLTLIDSEDRKLGKVEAIYVDAQTDQPQWMAVKTGLWGSERSFVPLADATPVGDAVRTPYVKSQIDDAPRLAAEEDLPDDQVVELYRYYGLDYDVPVDGDVDIAGSNDRVPAIAPGTQGEQDMLVATGHESEVAGYAEFVPRTQGEQDMLIATGQIMPRAA